MKQKHVSQFHINLAKQDLSSTNQSKVVPDFFLMPLARQLATGEQRLILDMSEYGQIIDDIASAVSTYQATVYIVIKKSHKHHASPRPGRSKTVTDAAFSQLVRVDRKRYFIVRTMKSESNSSSSLQNDRHYFRTDDHSRYYQRQIAPAQTAFHRNVQFK